MALPYVSSLLALNLFFLGFILGCELPESDEPTTKRQATRVSFQPKKNGQEIRYFDDINLAAESRPAMLLPPAGVTSEPIQFGPTNQLVGAIALKTFGKRPSKEDQPSFRIFVDAGDGPEPLFALDATPSLGRDVWVPFRVDIPPHVKGLGTVTLMVEGSSTKNPAMPLWSPLSLLSQSETDLPNVVFIVLDTLRADRTNAHGYMRQTSPFLERLAERGARVSEMIAPYPTTLPSHWAMFTGAYPVRDSAYDRRGILSSDRSTLAQQFQGSGYLTAAFTEGGFVHSYFGLSRGFDSYDNGPDIGTNSFTGSATETLSKATTWIDTHRTERFFLFVQTYEVHTPYDPSDDSRRQFSEGYRGRWTEHYPATAAFEINNRVDEITTEEVAQIGALYDAEILDLDRALERFIRTLDAQNLLENTILVVTADHGEDLFEHGWMQHGTTVYEPAIHVPFVVVWPSQVPDGVSLNCMRSLVDVAPTLLELAGITPTIVDMDGESFSAALTSGRCSDRAEAFAELQTTPYRNDPGVPLVAVREPRWKLVHRVGHSVSELYDLLEDDGEKRDLAALHLERVNQMEERVAWYLSLGGDVIEREPVSPAIERQLRALGYIE